MAAPMESDTSSSEDDEQRARLAEAVSDGHDYMTVAASSLNQSSCNKEKGGKEQFQKLPSKRPDKEVVDIDTGTNFLNTTPGFRKHVARKLSESLDSEIDTRGECFQSTVPVNQLPLHDTGVRLFGSSKTLLTSDCGAPEKTIQPKRPRKVSSSSDSSSEDERLAEASVSHDFVVQQSTVPFHTHQKPADIVISVPEVKDTGHIRVKDTGLTEVKDNGTTKVKNTGLSNIKGTGLIEVKHKIKDNTNITGEPENVHNSLKHKTELSNSQSMTKDKITGSNDMASCKRQTEPNSDSCTSHKKKKKKKHKKMKSD